MATIGKVKGSSDGHQNDDKENDVNDGFPLIRVSTVKYPLATAKSMNILNQSYRVAINGDQQSSDVTDHQQNHSQSSSQATKVSLSLPHLIDDTDDEEHQQLNHDDRSKGVNGNNDVLVDKHVVQGWLKSSRDDKMSHDHIKDENDKKKQHQQHLMMTTMNDHQSSNDHRHHLYVNGYKIPKNGGVKIRNCFNDSLDLDLNGHHKKNSFIQPSSATTHSVIEI